MTKEEEIVRSVFDAYIRDAKATSTKKDRPTFDMLEKVKNRAIKALEQQPSDDYCVSRQAVLDILSHYAHNFGADNEIKALSSVTPTHGNCKDCRHWKDSDGVYRRGVGTESKCPINNSRVFEGTFYCADFEKRGGENEVN